MVVVVVVDDDVDVDEVGVEDVEEEGEEEAGRFNINFSRTRVGLEQVKLFNIIFFFKFQLKKVKYTLIMLTLLL